MNKIHINACQYVNVATCQCVTMYSLDVKDTCKDDMLLHYTFDDTFNDVTCKHAISTIYGKPEFKYSAERGSNVACFDGHSYLEVKPTCVLLCYYTILLMLCI